MNHTVYHHGILSAGLLTDVPGTLGVSIYVMVFNHGGDQTGMNLQWNGLDFGSSILQFLFLHPELDMPALV